MGIFDLPRVHFHGHFAVNPGTGNNDSISPGTAFVPTADSQRVQPILGKMTPDEFKTWIRQLTPFPAAPGLNLLRCQWNLMGDMTLKFLDVEVVSVQTTVGEVITDPAVDPLIGASVTLERAFLCDNNPEGFNTTQIFSDALVVRSHIDRPAFGAASVFQSRHPTCATTRGINWYRNVSFHGTCANESSGGAGGASAGFQSSIEVKPEDLLDASAEGASLEIAQHRLLAGPYSPAIRALVAVLGDTARRPRGLTFRYNLYLSFPPMSDAEMAAEFAAGRDTENPAVGLVLGTIAPWFDGEPASATIGRKLNPTTSYVNPYRQDHKPYYLAPLVARVDPTLQNVAIDVSNTFPEDGPDADKYFMGDVTLGIRDPTPPATDPNTNTAPISTIGTIDNTRDAFVSHGGVVDISYAGLSPDLRAKLEGGDAELVISTSANGPLLYELEHQFESDSQCNYLDEPAPGSTWADVLPALRVPTRPVQLQGRTPLVLYRRGVPVTGPMSLTVEQWRMTPTGDEDQVGFYRWPRLLERRTVDLTFDSGWGDYELEPAAGTPGLRLFRFVPPTYWPQERLPNQLDNQSFSESVAMVRVLPYDDYSALIANGPTFDDVYREVFMYYDLIIPGMSKRLDMSDPTVWNTPAAAEYVLRSTNEAIWSTTTYMPRTRDLSACRRALLVAFCVRVIRTHAGDAAADAALAAAGGAVS